MIQTQNITIKESSSKKPFDRLLSQNKTTPNLFFELVNKLGKWFSITKATLSIHNHHTGILKVVSWWDLNALKQGVIISLPTDNSLFYKVMKSGELIHQQSITGFSGSYIEKRMMIDNETKDIVIYPLIYNEQIYGVVSLSSNVPCAFEMLMDGYLVTVFEKLASIIAKSDNTQSKFDEDTVLFVATQADMRQNDCLRKSEISM